MSAGLHRMLTRLKQAWKRDRLGVLGVGSAVVAILLIILPAEVVWSNERWQWVIPLGGGEQYLSPEYTSGVYSAWFTFERAPFSAILGLIAVLLLLLRRR